MPGETNQPSPGNDSRPEEGQTQGYTPKPIFGQPPKGAAPARPAPQAAPMPMGPIKPRVILSNTTERKRLPSPAGAEPRPLLPGAVIRHRIEATLEELSAENPGIPSDVLESARILVRTTNLDDDRDETILLWGAELQKDYSSLLERALSLVQDALIEDSKRLIADIASTLESLAPEHLLGEKTTGFGKLLASLLGTKSPKEIFDGRYDMLVRQIRGMEAKVPGLGRLKDGLEQLEKDAEGIGNKVVAATAAAAYLSRHLLELYERTGKTDSVLHARALAFARRTESLLMTRSALVADRASRELLTETINRLIECVQSVLLTEIPAWRTNYLGLFTIAMSAQEDTAALYAAITQAQQEILKKLKP